MRTYNTLPVSIITPKLIERFNSKVTTGQDDDCWEWGGARFPSGYGHLSLNFPETSMRKSAYAHRVAFVIANECDIPAGMVIMHTCDNPPCCNPRHLKLATFAQNSQDRDSKGRGRWKSTFHPEIVQLYRTGWTIKQLEDEFGFSGNSLYRWLKREGIPLRRREAPVFMKPRDRSIDS